MNFSSESLKVGAISINSDRGDILIVSYYRASKKDNKDNILKASEWKSLIDEISKYKTFIVVGYFNAFHPFWGSKSYCTSGNMIYNNTDFMEFYLLNDGRPTHYHI